MPGGGGAGIVLAVGDGVEPGWVGRHVLARGSGGYAARMVTGVDQIVPVPDGVSSADAAALLHDGATALGLLRTAAVAPGDWVLVAAAAGGAGSQLVQLARERRSPGRRGRPGRAEAGLARELGAEAAVDYSEDGWTDEVRAIDRRRRCRRGLRRSRRVRSARPPSTPSRPEAGSSPTAPRAAGSPRSSRSWPRTARSAVINALAAGPRDPATVRDLLTEALELAAAGRIRPVIGATFPLERAEDAHVSLEARRHRRQVAAAARPRAARNVRPESLEDQRGGRRRRQVRPSDSWAEKRVGLGRLHSTS